MSDLQRRWLAVLALCAIYFDLGLLVGYLVWGTS